MRPAVAFALAVLSFSSGCYPGISWLPDSSGFVYTGGKDHDQLLLFDVKAKKSRVVAKDIGGSAWPAVSADGKRIAVAHAAGEEEKLTLTVTVYDLQGKALHKSKPLPWSYPDGPKGKNDGSCLPQACWSPKGDRLLLYLLGKTTLYDLKSGKLTAVAGSLMSVGNRQDIPGGKGFLTVTKKRRWAVVSWDGKVQPLRSSNKTTGTAVEA